MKDLIPIGRFARSVRLSIKALRRYHDAGLLTPARVDPWTGYRAYAPTQAREAIIISMLRGLDLPLTVIKALLRDQDPEAIRLRLEAERVRLELEMARRREALASVERLLAAGALLPYEVDLQSEPPARLLTLSGEATPERLEAVTTDRIRTLLTSLIDHGVSWGGPVECHLLSPDGDRLPLRVAVQPDEAVEPPPEIEVLDRPATRWVVTRHVGAYESLGLAHHAVLAWAQARSLSTGELICERYINDPDQVPPEDLITEVCLPLLAAP